MAMRYSVAETRDNFPYLVEEVRRGSPVEVTLGDTLVAVLISAEQYQQLMVPRGDFWEALLAFRRSTDLADMEVDGFLQGLRDPSPGREVEL